jgi:hypothetical protein
MFAVLAAVAVHYMKLYVPAYAEMCVCEYI